MNHQTPSVLRGTHSAWSPCPQKRGTARMTALSRLELPLVSYTWWGWQFGFALRQDTGLLWTGCAPACVLCFPPAQIGHVSVQLSELGTWQCSVCVTELLFSPQGPPSTRSHVPGFALAPSLLLLQGCEWERGPKEPSWALPACDSPWSCGGQGTVDLPALLSTAQASCT